MGGMAISVDPGFLGGKLRALRDQLQIELDELSHGTGIEAAKLQAFEEGMSLPSGDEILVLADFYKYDYKFLSLAKDLLHLSKPESSTVDMGKSFLEQIDG